MLRALVQRLTIILCLFAAGALLLLIFMTQNKTAFWHVGGEIHDDFFGALRAIGTGVEIVFFAALVIAIIWIFIHLKRESGVYRPGKYGPIQAVKHGGELIELGGAIEGIGGMDPLDQIKYAQQLLQLAGVANAKLKGVQIVDEGEGQKQIEAPSNTDEPPLPEYVRYEDVAPHIPSDRALVGINGRGVVTREKGIKALIWIPGGSGSGKTNSACLRLDEDAKWGHHFLLIDPHWFKKDSMWNAIKGDYTHLLIKPIPGAERPFASETDEINVYLDWFINEFKRRKSGGKWKFPITIIIEEIGSLTADATEDEEELAMRAKIKTVTRICGQESRNFEMAGMCLSQDAAHLAWLRKRATMVIAHQLLMMSERRLACNENMEIARSMDNWPKGRTLIYGIDFRDGLVIYQQPARTARLVEADSTPHQSPEFYVAQTQQLSGQDVSRAFPEVETGVNTDEEPYEGNIVSFPGGVSAGQQTSGPEHENKNLANGNRISDDIRETIKRMKRRNMSDREIAPLVGLAGRKYPLYQEVCRELGFSSEKQAEGE